MSVEQAIHQRWQAYRPLTEQIAASTDPATNRLFTGAAVGDIELPYVTIIRDGDARIMRTSTGSVIRDTRIAINIWAATLERAKRIARRVIDRFNRAEFIHPTGRVLDMKWIDASETRRDDGTWLAALVFSVKTLDGEEH